MAPHNVPVIVECLTENRNRTGPDVKSLFKGGQFGSKVTFLFDHVGIVDATHEDAKDPERPRSSARAGSSCRTAREQAGGRFPTDVADPTPSPTRSRARAGRFRHLGYHPKDLVEPRRRRAAEVEAFFEKLKTTMTQQPHVALK